MASTGQGGTRGGPGSVLVTVTGPDRPGISARVFGALAPLGVALICYGLLFAAVVTVGRAYFHYWGATQSRYTTFDLLIPIGVVLCLLQPGALRRPAPDAGAASDASPAPRSHRAERRWARRPGRRWARRPGRRWPAWTSWAAGAVLAVVVVVQLAVGTPNGLRGARANHTYQVQATRVLLHLNQVPDNMAVFYLYPFRPASFIRAQAATARRMPLSVFADPPASAGAATSR